MIQQQATQQNTHLPHKFFPMAQSRRTNRGGRRPATVLDRCRQADSGRAGANRGRKPRALRLSPIRSPGSFVTISRHDDFIDNNSDIFYEVPHALFGFSAISMDFATKSRFVYGGYFGAPPIGAFTAPDKHMTLPGTIAA
nr:hypothetical protein [uncultured Rhodopila sp.]